MELLFTLSTWIYCRMVQYALGRENVETKLSSETKNGILGSCSSFERSMSLREAHDSLSGKTPFSRGSDGVYSCLSADERLLVQVSDNWQRIIINKPADSQENALQSVQQLLVLERTGNAWKIVRMVNKSFFENNTSLLEPLVDLLYDRQGAHGQYVAGGVMPQSLPETRFISEVAQKVCQKKHEWDEANKLVVKAGQEKSKKFKAKKNKPQQQEEESQPVSAEILEDGSIVVSTNEENVEKSQEQEYNIFSDEKPN